MRTQMWPTDVRFLPLSPSFFHAGLNSGRNWDFLLPGRLRVIFSFAKKLRAKKILFYFYSDVDFLCKRTCCKNIKNNFIEDP